MMKPEPSDTVLCGVKSRPLSPPPWRFLKSSKNSSNGEPGGSFGIVLLRSPPDGASLASTVCEVEMLTTASITFSATSAIASGPRADAGSAIPRLAKARQAAASKARRLQARVKRAAVLCGDASSSREQVPTSLENALAKAGIARVMSGLSSRRTEITNYTAPERVSRASSETFRDHERQLNPYRF